MTDNGGLSAIKLVGKNRIKKFNKIANELNHLLSDIRSDYPDAQYVVTENHIKLFIGDYVNQHTLRDLGYGRLTIDDNKEFEVADIMVYNLYLDVR